MAFDIIEFLEENHIPYKTSGAQVTKGWVNIQCPFCGDHNHHLGFSTKLNIFNCWRCGPKNSVQVISRLTDCSLSSARELVEKYFISQSFSYFADDDQPVSNRRLVITLPQGSKPLTKVHKNYLKFRNLDPDFVEKRFDLKGTMSAKEYAYRIIIPIYFQNKLVSFHSRDITGENPLKALACKRDKEVIHHKHLLYNYDQCGKNYVVVVEAPLDVMSLVSVGIPAVATFGIKFTEFQVKLLRNFQKVFIFFDSHINELGIEEEKTASQMAEKLADTLSIFVDAYVISEMGKDPNECSTQELKKLKKNIESLL